MPDLREDVESWISAYSIGVLRTGMLTVAFPHLLLVH